MTDLTSSIIGLEHSEGVGSPCSCGNSSRTTHCTECMHLNVTCDACMVASHQHTLFHLFEKWNGFYFSKIQQSSLGQSIRLRHGGKECPCKPRAESMTNMIVVDINGLHKSSVEFCFCYTSNPHWQQLVSVSLFPGSVDRPETLFTIRFLKLAHLLSTIGHISAMELTTVMRRLTNGAFQSDTPVS